MFLTWATLHKLYEDTECQILLNLLAKCHLVHDDYILHRYFFVFFVSMEDIMSPICGEGEASLFLFWAQPLPLRSSCGTNRGLASLQLLALALLFGSGLGSIIQLFPGTSEPGPEQVFQSLWSQGCEIPICRSSEELNRERKTGAGQGKVGEQGGQERKARTELDCWAPLHSRHR